MHWTRLAVLLVLFFLLGTSFGSTSAERKWILIQSLIEKQRGRAIVNPLNGHRHFHLNGHHLFIDPDENRITLDGNVSSIGGKWAIIEGALVIDPTDSNRLLSLLGMKPNDLQKDDLITSTDLVASESKSSDIIKVVIDPGHGGKDPGTLFEQVMEKDIVLEIARRLHLVLDRDRRYRSYLLRNDDYFISLAERCEFARNLRADISLSIHVNWSKRAEASGFETYYLSPDFSDEDARRQAEIENAGEAKEEFSSLQWVLSDLKNNIHNQMSAKFATIIQEHLGSTIKGENRGVKHAPFFVLFNADLPSVLVELGFISNEEDRMRLNFDQSSYINALKASIDEYVEHVLLDHRSQGFVR